jgi:hypothetical protein
MTYISETCSIWILRIRDEAFGVNDSKNTILNNYPCPAIFLYEEISAAGTAHYHVVDGKQRLVTCFEFVENEFSVYEESTISSSRGKYFKDFTDQQKLDVWRYQFAVEFVPQEDERLITEIFDRINRNVARLTRQELRHARFYGDFMQEVETSTEKVAEILPQGFPAMASQSKKQMKDFELVSSLLLLVEEGARSYSQDQIDAAYSSRDVDWLNREEVSKEFTDTVISIRDILAADQDLIKSRLKNQADFYRLVGGVHKLIKSNQLPQPQVSANNLKKFLTLVDDEEIRLKNDSASSYYAASRSASNDQGPRISRINIIENAISGRPML